jgi:hypothetical protein
VTCGHLSAAVLAAFENGTTRVGSMAVAQPLEG